MITTTDLPIPDGVPRNTPEQCRDATRAVLRLGVRHWVPDEELEFVLGALGLSLRQAVRS